jgi:hypothetical protein
MHNPLLPDSICTMIITVITKKAGVNPPFAQYLTLSGF